MSCCFNLGSWCTGCICGQQRDRYNHKAGKQPLYMRIFICCCRRDKFVPWKMLGRYRWELLKKTYRPHKIYSRQLTRAFKKAAMPDGTNPGTVRLRTWSRKLEHPSIRLMNRVLNPKGREVRYLVFEQFLEAAFDLCCQSHASMTRKVLTMFNPDLVKVSPSKVLAICKFVWGPGLATADPALHRLVLTAYCDTFTGPRRERDKDEGREKRSKDEYVSPEDMVEFMLRYPLLYFPAISLQRAYFRRVFGEKYWYEYHKAKPDDASLPAPAGFYVDNVPHARMLTGRVLLLDTMLCRELRLRPAGAELKMLPQLERLRHRFQGKSTKQLLTMVYAGSRRPTSRCIACDDSIQYTERTVHAYTRKQGLNSVTGDALSTRSVAHSHSDRRSQRRSVRSARSARSSLRQAPQGTPAHLEPVQELPGLGRGEGAEGGGEGKRGAGDAASEGMQSQATQASRMGDFDHVPDEEDDVEAQLQLAGAGQGGEAGSGPGTDAGSGSGAAEAGATLDDEALRALESSSAPRPRLSEASGSAPASPRSVSSSVKVPGSVTSHGTSASRYHKRPVRRSGAGGGGVGKLNMHSLHTARSRLERLLAAPKRLDTGFCTLCQKLATEALAAKYGYRLAREVVEMARVQKTPTDVENWTGPRVEKTDTKYTQHALPQPEFAKAFTLVDNPRAPDDQLAELEIWYRFFDEGTEEYFYYNMATGEATWDEPDEYLLSEENQLGIIEDDVGELTTNEEVEALAVRSHRI